MTARQINTILWTAAGACCAASAVTIVIALVLPVSTSQDGESDALSVRPSTSTTMHATTQSAALADAIWSRTLRGSLTDAPLAAASTATPSTPGAGNALSLALVGMIGDSLAMIRLADGSVVVRAVGEDVAGANVLAIGPAGVEVSINGQHVVLEKPRPATSTGVVVEKAL